MNCWSSLLLVSDHQRQSTVPSCLPRTGSAARRGTAAAEFALVLPVLIVLCLGCVDLGRFLYDQITLSNAVRSASQYGATHRLTPYTQEHWESQLTQTLEREASNIPGFDPQRLTISIETPEGLDNLPRVDVEATYPFETIVDWPGLPAEVLLHHRVSMQQYR